MKPTRDSTPARFGTLMIVISLLIVLGMLTWWFNSAVEQQYNPNQSVQGSTTQQGINVVTLKRNRSNHYVVNGKINLKPVVFFLDTGATDVAIPEHLAKKFNLKKGRPVRVMTANGAVQVYQTTIDNLAIGSILLHNVSATINPYMDWNQVLLGMSALRELEFSQKGDTLTLKQYPSTRP